MVLVQIMSDQTGHGEFIVAATKPEIPVYQLLSELETKFQRLRLNFRGPAIVWNYSTFCTTQPDMLIYYGGLQSGNICISASLLKLVLLRTYDFIRSMNAISTHLTSSKLEGGCGLWNFESVSNASQNKTISS